MSAMASPTTAATPAARVTAKSVEKKNEVEGGGGGDVAERERWSREGHTEEAKRLSDRYLKTLINEATKITNNISHTQKTKLR